MKYSHIIISLLVGLLLFACQEAKSQEVYGTVYRSTVGDGVVVHISYGTSRPNYMSGSPDQCLGFYSDSQIHDDLSRVQQCGEMIPGASTSASEESLFANFFYMRMYAASFSYSWYDRNCGDCVDFAIQLTFTPLALSNIGGSYKWYAIAETSLNILAKIFNPIGYAAVDTWALI